MSPNELAESKRREFAIKCREIRLYMHANPGLTNFELVRKFGKRADFSLGYMSNMGIVEAKRSHHKDGGCSTRWYVVPQ